MSGIYLPNMEMPKSCYKCPMKRRDGLDIVCTVAHEHFSVADVNILDYRLDNCPLIPVPEHGRLIDEKEVLTGCGYIIADGMACIPVKHIANAPTIIPATFENLPKSKDSQKIEDGET